MTPPADLLTRDHAAVWHPCSQMHDYRAFEPMEVVAAQGLHLELADGRRLMDGISSWWCKSLGHRHPTITDALKRQADTFEHVILANTTSEATVRLCERVLALANRGGTHFTKVFFTDNGSTGVEVALKMALQAQAQRGRTRRTGLACLRNGYHGETAAAMSVSDLDLYNSPHGPLMVPTLKLDGLPYRSGPGDAAWQDASAEWPGIEAQLQTQADTLAAVIVEPVLQCAGRMRCFSPDLLRRLRRWCDDHAVLLIADEIAAGCYRLGTPLAWHHACTGCTAASCARNAGAGCGILPDLAVLSKGLTAGYLPMAVVLATEPLYQTFYGPYNDHIAFMHSNTYAGNALAVAVAHAALDVYGQTDIAGNVERVGGHLAARFAALPDVASVYADPRGVGMAAAIDLRHPDGTTLDPTRRTGYAVYREATRRGALLRPLGDTMYLFPPLNITEDEVDALVAVLTESVAAVLGAG